MKLLISYSYYLRERLQFLYLRFRYPISLPEEVGEALGISCYKLTSITELIDHIASPHCFPTKIYKFMSRDDAEELFSAALKKERFHASSLFSYYFHEGWMEFVLIFGEDNTLRRVYMQHKAILEEEGVELCLKNDTLRK